MPALPMMEQFIPMIKSGRKIHTVRREHKNPIRVGQPLYIYTDFRTPKAKLQVVAECIKTVRIRILCYENIIEMEDFRDSIGDIVWKTLSKSESSSFAWHDGFNELGAFFQFFTRYDSQTRMEKLWVHYFKVLENDPNATQPKTSRLRNKPAIHSRDAWFSSLNTWRP